MCACVSDLYSGSTLLFDLPNLPHSLLEDGTLVRLDVEAVDVGEVGGDELSQLLDVLALLFPPTLVTPAGAPRGLDVLPWQPHLSMPRPYAGYTAWALMPQLFFAIGRRTVEPGRQWRLREARRKEVT